MGTGNPNPIAARVVTGMHSPASVQDRQESSRASEGRVSWVGVKGRAALRPLRYRQDPRVPARPAIYRALVYVPLLLTEITTLLLMRLSPMVRLTRATFFSFALMLAVWAAWALAGFGYPSAPLPIALNIASKILAFVTAFTLFLAQQPAVGTSVQGRRDNAHLRCGPGGNVSCPSGSHGHLWATPLVMSI